ncbi:MAG: APC family permease [Bacteroidetes bacterium]|nr:APC family permease [Bacteroidota bacterium]
MEKNNTQPKQPLRFFDLTMIVVSLVIGMGIFKTPASVAKVADSSNIFFLAWIIGGVVALSGALTFAEIGSRLPVSGGYYRIFSHCYHPAFAFMLNGTILISNAASVAGVALIGAEYITPHFLYEDWNKETINLVVAVSMIVIFFGLNLLGLKTSSRTQNVLTVFKLVVVTALCFTVFFPSNETKTVQEIISTGPHSFLKSLGLCLIPISFTYGGYQQTINFGGEVENAPRIMPRAIIAGMIVVTILYLSINFAYMHIIGFHSLKSAETIGQTLSAKILGNIGGKIFSLLLFFSVLAYVNIGLLSNPRVIMAMSEEKTLPAFFSYHSKKFNVPVWSLVAFTLVTVIVLFFAKTFDTLVNYVIFLDSSGFVFAAATIFILRYRKTGEEKKIYKLFLYPVLPALFIIAYLLIAFSVVMKGYIYPLYDILVFVFFLLLYFVFNFRKRK